VKTSSVSFGQLRHLLLDLHFNELHTDSFWRFEHSKSGAVFLFRPYHLDEYVSLPDLTSARTHLDWRGLLSAEAFDDSLTKTPA
jgi:hypothetical protein